MLEHERSKAKNSITKNASKFKREVTMPEFENREDKSASENAKALKHIFKSKMNNNSIIIIRNLYSAKTINNIQKRFT